MLTHPFFKNTTAATSGNIASLDVDHHDATCVTTTAHGCIVGSVVYISGNSATADGNYTITGVPNSTTLEFSSDTNTASSPPFEGTWTKIS